MDQQHLIFADEELKDGRTLTECGVVDFEPTLRLLHLPRATSDTSTTASTLTTAAAAMFATPATFDINVNLSTGQTFLLTVSLRVYKRKMFF